MIGSDRVHPGGHFPLILCASLFTFLISSAPRAAGADLKSLQSLWQESVAAEMDGDLERAAALTDDYRIQGGDSYLAALRCGWLCYLKKDYGKAIAYYKIAKGVSPRSLAPLLGLADSHLARQDTRSAIRVFKAALRIDPNHYAANLSLGKCYYQKEDFERAASHFERVQQLYKDDLDANSWLAWSLVKKGENQKAASLFRYILVLAPRHPRAAEGLRLSRRPAQ